MAGNTPELRRDELTSKAREELSDYLTDNMSSAEMSHSLKKYLNEN